MPHLVCLAMVKDFLFEMETLQTFEPGVCFPKFMEILYHRWLYSFSIPTLLGPYPDCTWTVVGLYSDHTQTIFRLNMHYKHSIQTINRIYIYYITPL